MAFALAPEARAAGYRLRRLDTVGSTNTEATALGRAGERGPLWVVSEDQVAGRGRRGNVWAGAPGNLAATLLLNAAYEARIAATLGFVAGLAVRDGLMHVAGGPAYKLKWPNDVLADGAKLGGILLETEIVATDHRISAEKDQRIIAVGIGVNVVASPSDVPYPATSLAECGCWLTAGEVFEALSESWVGFERIWDEGRGMRRIRELWLERAAGLGEPVAVRLGGETVGGVFETIDGAGQLILRSKEGTFRAIAAGEVHFGDAATVRELA
jgi:BirA family biotin operon repressor/biotin-[acetyl-CoA-carboxylase] ligase